MIYKKPRKRRSLNSELKDYYALTERPIMNPTRFKFNERVDLFYSYGKKKLTGRYRGRATGVYVIIELDEPLKTECEYGPLTQILVNHHDVWRQT